MMRVLFAIAACLTASEACTCFPFPALRDAFCYSSFVAHVRVTGSIEDTDSRTIRYNVRYLETFRNETESKQLPTEIVTASTTAACGVQLINGTEYLIGELLLV
ncbi:unnamed protein product [Haemonchus placei]|uniref:NTR domain-containing protein n=1 Tax=Haemonchus placei TaxID=6290 RepID=A0A0N4W517_HAEPC|nr:unnamed protein product [Haemonchus placei]